MELLRTLAEENSLYLWGIGLVLGISFLVVLLGEFIERMTRTGNPLVDELQQVRNLVLPLLSVRLLLEFILGFSGESTAIRLVETLFWLVVVFVLFRIFTQLMKGIGGTLVTDTHALPAGSWRISRVWSELLRLASVVGIGFYVLGGLWGVPTQQVMTALGVGSIVIGFALQDTLSSLVAGMLLAFEKPFEVGHWLRYSNYEGQIIEMNWRAVRLRTRERDVVIVPNSVLGKDVAVNYTLLDPLHAELVQARFHYHHSPNQVKRALLEVMLATPGVAHNPLPHVRIAEYDYDKFAIHYEVKYYIQDYGRMEFIRDEALTRIYYMAQRHQFTIPYQTTIFYQRDGKLLEPSDPFAELLKQLQMISYFATLSPHALEQLARHAALHQYGSEEQLIRQNEFFAGFYIILEGQVRLTVHTPTGRTPAGQQNSQEIEVATLNKADFFGETVLMREQPSPFTITVTKDLKALFIERSMLIEAVETNPRLATEMNRFIEARHKAVQRVLDTAETGGQGT